LNAGLELAHMLAKYLALKIEVIIVFLSEQNNEIKISIEEVGQTGLDPQVHVIRALSQRGIYALDSQERMECAQHNLNGY
jgi:hypothetical protein